LLGKNNASGRVISTKNTIDVSPKLKKLFLGYGDYYLHAYVDDHRHLVGFGDGIDNTFDATDFTMSNG
jgi:hypothetical protein